MPAQSKPTGCGPSACGSCGRKRAASRRAANPNGTATKKVDRHPSPAMSSPPSDGPRAVPMADMVPIRPMAPPIRSLGTVPATNARLSAIMIAAPAPWTALPPISQPRLGADPHRRDARVKRPIPASSSRRRPTRSPARPAPTIKAVIVSR